MIKTCRCEDFPCCGHGEDFPVEPDYPSFDEIDHYPDDEEEW